MFPKSISDFNICFSSILVHVYYKYQVSEDQDFAGMFKEMSGNWGKKWVS